MITFILGFLIGLIVMFLFYVKTAKEISSKTISSILENCVEKIELYEWNVEKTVNFLNKTSNKLRKREKYD